MFYVATITRTFNSLTVEILNTQFVTQIELRYSRGSKSVLDSIVNRIEASLTQAPDADELQEGDTLLIVPFHFGGKVEPQHWYRVSSLRLVEIDPSIETIEF